MTSVRFRCSPLAMVVATAILASACGREAGILELDLQPDAEAFGEELERVVPDLMEEHGVPGVAIALIENGRTTWMRGFGVQDLESQEPVDPERTVFQVASISKSAVAWGVLRLWEASLLDLDAPIEDYLTRWSLPDSPFDSHGVTARRLLSHTAGLTPHGYPGVITDGPMPSLVDALEGRGNGADPVEIVYEPGTSWRYAGGGFAVLQLAIEEITGTTFSDYMRREVLGPLGMSRSSFEWSEALRPATATAYGLNGQRLENFVFAAKAPAGLYSTAADIARLIEASMSGPGGAPGRGLLAPQTVTLMHTQPEFAVNYGLGHLLLVLEDGTELPGHAGLNRGWRSFWVAEPDRGIGIVILSNSQRAADVPARIVCGWARSVVGSRVRFPFGITGCT